MVSLVTLERVKVALRVDTSDDDVIIRDAYIPAASAAVIDHLKSRAAVILDLDSEGDIPSGVEVPELIQVAVILLLKHWYDPEELRQSFEGDELPPSVKALLKPLRDPALA